MIKMMLTNVLIALTFLFAATLALAQHCRQIDIDKSSGFCMVPDPKLTPGAMDASLACVSNNDRPRSVSAARKECDPRRLWIPGEHKEIYGGIRSFAASLDGRLGYAGEHLVRGACWKVWLIHKRQSGASVVAEGVRQ
jgi:hypothetical protein